MDIWNPITALATLMAAMVAAWAANKANAAASKMTKIESQRRHSELCPRFRVACAPLNPGSTPVTLQLRVALVGPPGLDRLDKLTVAIRNDHFLRGEGFHQEAMGGPTREEIKAHIWGPYQFTPHSDDGGGDVPGGSDPPPHRRLGCPVRDLSAHRGITTHAAGRAS